LPYRYLEDIATADIAFEAWGETIEQMFLVAAEATMNVMVEDLQAIRPEDQEELKVEDKAIDLLLFKFLQELVFLKDAKNLLLRVKDVSIKKKGRRYLCTAQAYGEEVNPVKHALNVDIKAITFHRFDVRQTERGWKATVVLDI
jgi:SHS2 domain-containing protein